MRHRRVQRRAPSGSTPPESASLVREDGSRTRASGLRARCSTTELLHPRLRLDAVHGTHATERIASRVPPARLSRGSSVARTRAVSLRVSLPDPKKSPGGFEASGAVSKSIQDRWLPSYPGGPAAPATLIRDSTRGSTFVPACFVSKRRIQPSASTRAQDECLAHRRDSPRQEAGCFVQVAINELRSTIDY